MSELAKALLAKPTSTASSESAAKELTKQIEVKGDKAEVVINAPSEVEQGEGRAVLELHGLQPADWEITGFKASEWTMNSGERGVSTRFTFARRKTELVERPSIDELLPAIQTTRPAPADRENGNHGYIVALGDMQWGKIDGDGFEGTLSRTLEYLDQAYVRYWDYAKRFDFGHVHVAWLGDHVEGFNSQGGANVWRTNLTLSEQIRLTRRVMLHALLLFSDAAERVSMAAIPGNHGDTTRFAGKGITRYDDSHDTESLIAVADAAALNPAAFEHVEFYVPKTDEQAVTLNVAGSIVGHVHGNQWRAGKHFEWWKGQAFDPANPLGQADLLLAGHYHHELIESDGRRLFIQVPSLESESTWFKLNTGTSGNPGLVVAVTKDGKTSPLEFVR